MEFERLNTLRLVMYFGIFFDYVFMSDDFLYDRIDLLHLIYFSEKNT